MKAISIKQPWASLIIWGIKPIENRTWKPYHTGETLIHASSKWDKRSINNLFSIEPLLNIPPRYQRRIEKKDSSISGFNIGINDGIDAGQTVLHCHIHLIPRRKGDVIDLRGGIRHIIPDKGFYG